MQTAMNIIQRLPPSLRKPVMQTAMAAMQNPPEAIRRAALATLPLNLILLFFPHFMKIGLLLQHNQKYDNTNPRGKDQQKRQAEHPWSSLISRLQAAHRNSLETFPVFAVALLACIGRQAASKRITKTKAPIEMLRLAFKYTAGRALYIMLYVFGANQLLGSMRTLSYFHNMYCIFKLFGLAITAPLA